MLKKIFIIIICLVLALFSIYLFEVYAPPQSSRQEVNFSIVKGSSVKQISQNLEAVGLIRSSNFFKYYVWLKNKQTDLKAGEYILNPKMSLKKIVAILAGGQALSNEQAITIIEGWNIDDINNYFQKNNIFSDDSFANLAKAKLSDWKLSIDKPEFLAQAPSDANLEGFLFPDTYRIFKGATVDDVIIKMLKNFDSKLTKQIRDDIARENKSIYQIITLASLIEKEVRTSEDMQIVSGIFWDRIANGQALESCATLAYILGEKKIQYSAADTQVDSSYNTYKNLGLPPGPITNPGLNSIKAAIHPKYTEYNYFLSRPDTGETVYSRALDEHNRKKAKYLK